MIKSILRSSLKSLLKIYPVSTKSKIDYYRGIIYSLWISKYIGKLGDGSSIGIGCQIQGGVIKAFL